jgi:hypothetical protein
MPNDSLTNSPNNGQKKGLNFLDVIFHQHYFLQLQKKHLQLLLQMVNLIFAVLYIYDSCAVPWYRGKSKVQIVGNLTKYCDIGVAIAGPAAPTLR